MAITIDDFSKIWASTSPLTPYEFSEKNYKEGWNFVGATPPSRQMWDSIQKTNDEKTQWLYLNVVQGIPVGVVQAFAGATTPQGWLLCDGSAVSRTDYADLYAVVGDTYGAGDGSTTFNLPNLVDKFVEGSSTAGTTKAAGLPNITGSKLIGFGDTSAVGSIAMQNNATTQSGALYSSKSKNPAGGKYFSNATETLDWQPATLEFDASLSSTIYGNSTTVQPPALTMRYIIKY